MKSSFAARVLTILLRCIRPGSAPVAPEAVLLTLGWHLRKGVLPAFRGIGRASTFGGVQFPIFVGKRVTIMYPRRVRMGRWSSIGDGCTINAFSAEGVHLGTGVTIREGAWVQCSSSPNMPGVGLVVGDNSYLGPGAILGIGGPVVIGSRCQVGAGLTVVAENHVLDPDGLPTTEVTRRGITIGDDVWIGHRVTILDGVTLGDRVVVGAGAVVTRSFSAGTKIAGVPARAIVRDEGGDLRV